MPQRPVDDWYVRRIARHAGAGYKAPTIYKKLQAEARAEGRKDSPPSAKTINNYIDKLGLSGEPTLRAFAWPASMGSDLLPWEAGAAALELVRYRRERGHEPPTVGEAAWFWRVRCAAPGIPVESGNSLAISLALKDALRIIHPSRDATYPDHSDDLAPVNWGQLARTFHVSLESDQEAIRQKGGRAGSLGGSPALLGATRSPAPSRA
jgi:hypothetical protein